MSALSAGLSSKGVWAAIALLLAVFLGAGVRSNHLRSRDELRVAGIARAMALGKSSVAIPRLAGEPFLEKPPLGFAAVAASFKLFGASRHAARLPSTLFGLLGALFLALLAWDLYGSRAAALAAGVALLFNVEYFWLARRCMVDPPLIAGVIGSVALLRRAVDEPQRRWLWFPLATCLAALAFFSKGAIGLVFPVLAFLGLVWARRDFACLKSAWLWITPLVLAAPILIWLGAVYREGGEDALRIVVIDNHWRRFFPDEGYTGGHQKPIYFYLDKLPQVLLPGLLLLPASLAWHYRQRERAQLREALWLALAWLGVGFVILSLAGTKRVVYLVPILAPSALLVGGWVGSLLEKRALSALERWTLRLLLGATLLAAPALPVALYQVGESVSLSQGAACLLVLGLGAAGLLHYRRARLGPFLLALACAGALAAGVFVEAFLTATDDELALPREFYEQVGLEVPEDAPLYVYPPHEATLGALTYYTGRVPLGVVVPAEAKARLRGSAPYYVLVAGKSYPGVDPPWQELAAPGVFIRLQGTHERYTTTLLSNRAPAQK